MLLRRKDPPNHSKLQLCICSWAHRVKNRAIKANGSTCRFCCSCRSSFMTVMGLAKLDQPTSGLIMLRSKRRSPSQSWARGMVHYHNFVPAPAYMNREFCGNAAVLCRLSETLCLPLKTGTIARNPVLSASNSCLKILARNQVV